MGEKPVYVSKRLDNGQVDFWWVDDATKFYSNLLKQGYEISKEALGYRFVDTNGDVREMTKSGFVNHGKAITKESFEPNPIIGPFLRSFADAATDSLTGMRRGFANVALGLVQPGGPVGGLIGVPNPFGTPYKYKNLTQAKFGVGIETGFVLGSILGGGPFVGGAARTPLGLAPNPVATTTVSQATSATQSVLLRDFYRQAEKYGSGGVRQLENGRFRFYGDLNSAKNPGTMSGTRFVREWNPSNGAKRSWLEALDQSGRVRIVRPESGGRKIHYVFDETGKFVGVF